MATCAPIIETFLKLTCLPVPRQPLFFIGVIAFRFTVYYASNSTQELLFGDCLLRKFNTLPVDKLFIVATVNDDAAIVQLPKTETAKESYNTMCLLNGRNGVSVPPKNEIKRRAQTPGVGIGKIYEICEILFDKPPKTFSLGLY